MSRPLAGTAAYSRGFRREMPETVPGYPFVACLVDILGHIVATSEDRFRYPADAEDYVDTLWHRFRRENGPHEAL